MAVELAALTLSLFLLGAAEDAGSDAAPVATLEQYRAARQKLDQAMRAKAVIYADLPKEVQAQVDQSNAAYSAGTFTAAIEALREPTAWAVAVVVDATFVAEKLGRASQAGRQFLRSPRLSEEQGKAVYARLDKAAEAMAADRVDAANALLNELFEYLKTLPSPEPAKSPVPEAATPSPAEP